MVQRKRNRKQKEKQIGTHKRKRVSNNLGPSLLVFNLVKETKTLKEWMNEEI